MALEADSLSGTALSYTSRFRNTGGLKERVLSQAFFTALTVVSIQETIIAMSLTALTEITLPQSLQMSRKWAQSSDFSRYWSVTCLFYNPFVREMPENEKDAKHVVNIEPLTLFRI